MILALCLDRPELADDWLGLEDDIFTQTEWGKKVKATQIIGTVRHLDHVDKEKRKKEPKSALQS